MSCIINNNLTHNIFDCTDTPLSISGNIISILTFFIAALATYLAFFDNIHTIPQSADSYSADIRSLHTQLWTIADIHSSLTTLVSSQQHHHHPNSSNGNGNTTFRISTPASLTGDPLKEARQFLSDYAQSHEDVFTNYFSRHRWVVRLKWVAMQKKVARFKSQAGELRGVLMLDLLGLSLNMNIALQQSLQQRDMQTENLSTQVAMLNQLLGAAGGEGNTDIDVTSGSPRRRGRANSPSPSPSTILDLMESGSPTFLVSPPEDENDRKGLASRSASPFSSRQSPETSQKE